MVNYEGKASLPGLQLKSAGGETGVLAENALKSYRITEWVGPEKAKIGQVVQPPCLSIVILEHIGQNCIQTVLEYFQ